MFVEFSPLVDMTQACASVSGMSLCRYPHSCFLICSLLVAPGLYPAHGVAGWAPPPPEVGKLISAQMSVCQAAAGENGSSLRGKGVSLYWPGEVSQGWFGPTFVVHLA